MRTFQRSLLSKTAILSTGLLLCSIGAAGAQTPNWSGFQVYGGLSVSGGDGDVSFEDTATYSVETTCTPVPNQGFIIALPCVPLGPVSTSPDNNGSSDLNNDIGLGGFVGIGADFEPTDGVIIGAFLDGSFETAESDFTVGGVSDLGPFGFVDATTDISGTMELSNVVTIGGRIGALSANRMFLGYVLAGYSRAYYDNATATVQHGIDVPILGRFLDDPFTVALPDEYDGLTLGLGGEVQLSGGWRLKVEGRHTDLRSQTVSYARKRSTRTVLGVSEIGPGCSIRGDDCEAALVTRSEQSGTIRVDPDVWTIRIGLSVPLNSSS